MLRCPANVAIACNSDTLTYVHLSGRELADKLARGMDHIHAWRVEMLARLGGPENGRR